RRHPAPQLLAQGSRMRVSSLLLSFLVLASSAAAQSAPASRVREMSLEDAIRLADRSSQVVEIARAGVTRAQGQQQIALSQYPPPLGVPASYARTLRSQFSGFSATGTVDTSASRPQSLCAPEIPANATPAERQAALDQATTCQATGTINFSKVGFGALNQWV